MNRTGHNIYIENDLTVLEWDIFKQDIENARYINIERKINHSDWENFGKYIIAQNKFLYKFYLHSGLDGAKDKIFSFKYRFIIENNDGSFHYSENYVFDLWWEKYIRFIDAPQNCYDNAGNEIYQFIYRNIQDLIYSTFRSTFNKLHIDELYVIDEAAQEIVIKLFEHKYRPSGKFINFKKFINVTSKNWIISYLRKESRNPFFLSDFNEIEDCVTPEDYYISSENKKQILDAFQNLFTIYISDLNKKYPNYALAVEFWVNRKGNFVDELSELFQRNSREIPFRKDISNENTSGDTLYSLILNDFIQFMNNEILMGERLKCLSSKKRDIFVLDIKKLGQDQRSLSLVKKWVSRGLAIIRVKMLHELE